MMTSIIIVDDQSNIVEASVAYLESYGLEVLGIGYDGNDAIALYKRLKPDVVILDMNMPKYDGAYAVNEIKKINPNAKIIICTGNVDDCELIKNQVSNILTKPCINDELLKAIREL